MTPSQRPMKRLGIEYSLRSFIFIDFHAINTCSTVFPRDTIYRFPFNIIDIVEFHTTHFNIVTMHVIIRSSDRRIHHGRCPRLLAALEYAEQQQQQQQQGVASGGGSLTDFAANSPPTQTAILATALSNNGGSNGNLAIAPRASPEISEADVSSNVCHRMALHRTSSVSCNGSDNVFSNATEASIQVCSVHAI